MDKILFYLYYQILSINKIPVASIGTLGIKKNDKLKKTKPIAMFYFMKN